jgi:hypothetical protein
LHRIAAVDTADARQGDWAALHEALEPLLYYFHDADPVPRNLIIENPNARDSDHYMAATRIAPDTPDPPPPDATEQHIRSNFLAFWHAMARYEDTRWQNRNARVPERELEDVLYSVYDVPQRARDQSDFANGEDPQGLQQFFQTETPAFNDAMFMAAVVMNVDPTLAILYYEHILKVLQRMHASRASERPVPRDMGALLTELSLLHSA